ncbi:hypothetical protein [Arthrobacter sp. KK5.5]|uniref:hypothetical protein n=1 Tax=Arthrobacter sp. KK5.5 TaxID=3373084 RepID=UPI003EE62C4C
MPPDPEVPADGERNAGPEPQGFGFRTGVRSARVAFGIAVFLLVLATSLVFMGAALAVRSQAWWALAALGVLELGFIGAFAALATRARSRRIR